MRDAFLKETLFFDVDDARAKLAAGVTDDNSERLIVAEISAPRGLCRAPHATDNHCARPTTSADRPLFHQRHAA
jgi:hypothetical protein